MQLDHDDVVSMSRAKSPVYAPTFKVSEIITHITNRLGKDLDGETLGEWGWDGVECQVLKADRTGWQNGRVRLSLEFIADQEEFDEQETALIEDSVSSPANLLLSPLDDLRSDLNI